MKLLAADIGGTKSWMCLSTIDAEGHQGILFEHIYQSLEFDNANDLLARFIADAGATNLKIDKMCLALPGVVSKRKASLTNLDWELDADTLENDFSIDHVCFINDFAAAALGVSTLDVSECITLNAGNPIEKCTKVVTGAGTGLGLAWLNFVDGRYHPNATEGGHIDFAPTSSHQVALFEMLLDEHDHVSYERLLSGEGLQTIYHFLNRTAEEVPSPSEITLSANEGNELAIQTLELFVEIYAAYIGNLAMLYKPLGGLYIAGGIASKILPWMQSKEFLEICFNKGRMRKVVENTPIYLVTNDRLGLQGVLSLGKISR